MYSKNLQGVSDFNKPSKKYDEYSKTKGAQQTVGVIFKY